MKRTVLLCVATALLLLVPAGSALAEGDTHTLTGEYHWTERGAKGELEAIFTPTGKGTWDVSFNFEFRGRAHTYSGTAEGSLTEGALSGTVLNDDKRRTFKFSGAFEDGTFSGTHSEMRDNGEAATGSMSLGG